MCSASSRPCAGATAALSGTACSCRSSRTASPGTCAQEPWTPAGCARVLVDLSARRLTLFRNGRGVLRTPVAVGSTATPTPTGRYYVTQRLIPADASGPFGPAAIGISAYSTVLTGWTQGGPIAIHGTNEPWSIGRAVSNGCIRVRNDVLRRLFKVTPAGTPVLIRR